MRGVGFEPLPKWRCHPQNPLFFSIIASCQTIGDNYDGEDSNIYTMYSQSEVIGVIFVGLCKWKGKPDKETTGKFTEYVEEMKKKGFKILGWYWTLGRYHAVFIFEAPNEKDALKFSIDLSERLSIETLVAVPREEAIKLL